MNITIELHDNTKIKADVENYTPESFGELINTNHHEMLVFGNGGIAKHAIRRYYPTETEVAPDGQEG